jgi:hypothetical protein
MDARVKPAHDAEQFEPARPLTDSVSNGPSFVIPGAPLFSVIPGRGR